MTKQRACISPNLGFGPKKKKKNTSWFLFQKFPESGSTSFFIDVQPKKKKKLKTERIPLYEPNLAYNPSKTNSPAWLRFRRDLSAAVDEYLLYYRGLFLLVVTFQVSVETNYRDIVLPPNYIFDSLGGIVLTG